MLCVMRLDAWLFSGTLLCLFLAGCRCVASIVVGVITHCGVVDGGFDVTLSGVKLCLLLISLASCCRAKVWANVKVVACGLVRGDWSGFWFAFLLTL